MCGQAESLHIALGYDMRGVATLAMLHVLNAEVYSNPQ